MSHDDIRAALVDHIAAERFPCVGAKAALGQDRLAMVVAGDMRCPADDARIHREIAALITRYRADPRPFCSLAVLFDAPMILDESEFETALWQRLQALSDLDSGYGYAADPRVSAHPQSPDFAPSFAGQGFYIVGLHPHASRPARRFARPAMIFNIHDQFEMLRRQGGFDRLREQIVDRDISLTGSRNPMLADHGDRSAAPQYSGRAVAANWTCPYARRAQGETRDAA